MFFIVVYIYLYPTPILCLKEIGFHECKTYFLCIFFSWGLKKNDQEFKSYSSFNPNPGLSHEPKPDFPQHLEVSDLDLAGLM